MTDAFHGRDTAAPAAPPLPAQTGWVVDPDTEDWSYQPPSTPAGFQRLYVRQPDGYDFARLVWQVCDECRIGLIAKIRVTGPWQRHGYGSRMVRLALRDCDGYHWTTTPQSEFARAFFPAVTAATGVDFPAQTHLCEHMRAREPRHFEDSRPLTPPPRWPR
ncbi:hypothetical protein ACFQ6O_44610 [Streptomyces sp. NPDC056441]|uniref:hypothetical protein n=1 Tax=Streptomyces sp. NPDC056441 TaxID=3345817 RepID=UPI0036CC2D60